MKKPNSQTSLLLIFTSILWIINAPASHAQDQAGNISLRKEVERVYHETLVLLEKEQNLEGYWSSPDYPGLTALVLRAYLESPVDSQKWQTSDAVARAVDFLNKNVQEDGGIYKRGLYSYNTAISLMTLNVYNDVAAKRNLGDEAERSKLTETLIAARNFLVKQQQIYSKEDLAALSGGIGYGNSLEHSDLSNTSFAIQALHETRELAEKAEVPAKLDWDAAIEFLENTQNLPSVNKQEWASDHPDHVGGFAYYPGNSMAGSFETPDGKTVHRSYGSMSYAGLMSFVYAGLEKDDPRVKAAVQWLQAHFSLDENPGMDKEGLYYYYYTMAKALNAYGTDTLVLADGTEVKWRQALARKLVSLHKHPGYWINENSRWMEKDPFLVSAYTLLALKNIYPEL